MELTYEIIKVRNNITYPDDIINSFKIFNLDAFVKENSPEKFLTHIYNNNLIDIANNMLHRLFRMEKNFGECLLMAYYISNYKKNFDMKLITLSTLVVKYLSQFINADKVSYKIYGKLLDVFDTYQSLYYCWKNKDQISNIQDKINQLNEIITCMNKVENYDYSTILNDIQESFQNYPLESLKLFLQSYKVYKLHTNIKNAIWNNIGYINKNKIQMILIMIAEIRLLLIQTFANIENRKMLYYDIDVENIVDKIRNNKFKPKYINKIIIKLIYVMRETKIDTSQLNQYNNLKKINQEYINTILCIFRQMYDTL